MIFGLEDEKCCCGEKATTIVVMLISIERKVEYDSFATYNGQFPIHCYARKSIMANTELILACDNCQAMWDGFSALKCRIGNEIPKQLVEIVQEKHRLMSL